MTFDRPIHKAEAHNRNKRAIQNRICMIGWSGVTHRAVELANGMKMTQAEFWTLLEHVARDNHRRTSEERWYNRVREANLRAYELTREDI